MKTTLHLTVGSSRENVDLFSPFSHQPRFVTRGVCVCVCVCPFLPFLAMFIVSRLPKAFSVCMPMPQGLESGRSPCGAGSDLHSWPLLGQHFLGLNFPSGSRKAHFPNSPEFYFFGLTHSSGK